ncbi:CHRD domain-containing protein [Marininema mesophilum]|uniref:CHRD domain-containing protein n=1 Tax=Marininema mesophilum TaxID=1048340 RepID=A0A1H3BBY6_9BACL|nr:CHRD domain-containing protein [Marininema mesophilum]SDX39540.1 CHRD domain-containing protein [Marininema mesophilum]
MSRFTANLVGREEVPPVKTKTTGVLNLKVNQSETLICYRLRVFNIKKLTQAHLHLAPRGENGPVVAFLFGPTTPGISTPEGTITGTIRSADLVGPLKNKTIADLITQIRQGNIYANVHNERFPNGVIRGQVRRLIK